MNLKKKWKKLKKFRKNKIYPQEEVDITNPEYSLEKFTKAQQLALLGESEKKKYPSTPWSEEHRICGWIGVHPLEYQDLHPSVAVQSDSQRQEYRLSCFNNQNYENYEGIHRRKFSIPNELSSKYKSVEKIIVL